MTNQISNEPFRELFVIGLSVECCIGFANVLFAIVCITIGAGFCDYNPFAVFMFFGFYLVNVLFSLFRKGMACQIIVFLSNAAFPLLVVKDFYFAFYMVPDPQSGLVLLTGTVYSFLMIPFWGAALLLSKNRNLSVVAQPIPSDQKTPDSDAISGENPEAEQVGTKESIDD